MNIKVLAGLLLGPITALSQGTAPVPQAGSNGTAQIGFQPSGGSVPSTVAAGLNSAFLYDIGFSSASSACASTKTIAVTSSVRWSALSTMTCAAPLWIPLG